MAVEACTRGSLSLLAPLAVFGWSHADFSTPVAHGEAHTVARRSLDALTPECEARLVHPAPLLIGFQVPGLWTPRLIEHARPFR